MYTVDLYLRVRLACHVDGLSQREAASRFGIARETVRKMLRHSEPPGYRRRQPPKRPKLAPFTDIIDRILEEDRTVHRKQHHTAKRIFERLRDEHGFTGKETIVKDYVRERRLRRREMFVPLSHPPGHAQADFGEADAIIAGVKYRAHFFVMTLPHSDACFVAAYPAAATEAWLDGHNRAFVFFGGVPQSILYDNDKCLVSRILSDGTRQAGAIYVVDRGYVDFARLYVLHQAGAFFVTRAKSNIDAHRVYSAPTDRSTGIICDQTISLDGFYTRQDYPELLRRIRFKDPESGKTLVFITNNFSLPAATICALYKSRWQVELFFKWIKQHLRIKQFYGTSENAVKTQIWIAVSVYVLVAIVKKRLDLDASLYTLLQILSVTLFEKMPIHQALAGDENRCNASQITNQLNLFDF